LSVIFTVPLLHAQVPPLLLDELPPLLLLDELPPLLLLEPPPLLVDPPPLLPPLDVELPLLLVLPPRPPEELVLVPPASFVSGSVLACPAIGLSTEPPQAVPTAESKRTERKMEEASRRSMPRAEQGACPP
jgi:hypothetical protein